MIRRLAAEKVAEAESIGWHGPPFCPRQLAGILGMQVVERSVLSGEAQLTPIGDDRYLIEVDPGPAAVRQNYSICHEIGHTLFPDCAERRRHRGPIKFDEVERLCQVAASELLMPEAAFRAASAQWGASLNGVTHLSDLFVASPEAVVRRLVVLTDEAVAAVFFSQRLKPTQRADERQMSFLPEAGPDPKMRVLYSARSGYWPTRAHIPPHKSVPDESPVVTALASPGVHRGCERWGCPQLGELSVEAMGLPLAGGENVDDTPSVVALVRQS